MRRAYLVVLFAFAAAVGLVVAMDVSIAEGSQNAAAQSATFGEFVGETPEYVVVRKFTDGARTCYVVKADSRSLSFPPAISCATQ